MKILSATEMRRVDRTAIEEWGIPSMVLMENAAIGVVDAICESFPEARDICVVCGPGNNGGDGLAIARHLTLRGYGVVVVLAQWSRNRSDDAEAQYEVCLRQGVPMHSVESEEELSSLRSIGIGCDLWVDAMFGTGLSRPLEGLFAHLTKWISDLAVPVVAVDLPSGLDASRREPIGPHAEAKMTVTFAALKHAHVFLPAAASCGQVVVADLGMPRAVLEEAGGSLSLLVAEELSSYLLEPRSDDHKGRYGHALVIGGSAGKGGAVVLAARAAVVSGAGLVTAGIPAQLLEVVETASLESMSLPLPADQAGNLTVDAVGEILEASADKQSIAIGPGLGTTGTTVAAVRKIVEKSELPMVIDADALNALADKTSLLKVRSAATVITPHPGEAARLFDTSIDSIQQDRVSFAREVAVEHRIVVVLKGYQTVVASPDGEAFVNSSGNSGMASGGSGDLLTGVIAALLAQDYDPVVASCLGVFVHGTAGDLAAETAGHEGLRAGTILEKLPQAFRHLRAM